MADTPNSALGTNEKMDDTDIALVKAMYCGKFDYFTLNYLPCLYFVRKIGMSINHCIS